MISMIVWSALSFIIIILETALHYLLNCVKGPMVDMISILKSKLNLSGTHIFRSLSIWPCLF